jgi:hypothetical protein
VRRCEEDGARISGPNCRSSAILQSVFDIELAR